jgi:hypothetical protein
MSGKSVTPSLGSKSFTCPHCGALSHQTWFRPYIDNYGKDQPPGMPDPGIIDAIRANHNLDNKEDFIRYFQRTLAKEVFLEPHDNSVYLNSELANVNISRCYSCSQFALWVADGLMYPHQGFTITPSADMPHEVKLDFIEAASIVDQSPRGAAALLRLCLQKLTAHLGLTGKKLDDDIGMLVKNGLDRRVQQALDVVRVIGNQAVHPGQIDLRDDKSTASKLFALVNLIIEVTVTNPKHVQEMFEALPDGALKAIEKRDGTNKEPEVGDQTRERNRI